MVMLLLAGVVWLPVAGAAAPTGRHVVVFKGSVESPGAVAAEQAQARGWRSGTSTGTR
jgi:hypothetical protein